MNAQDPQSMPEHFPGDRDRLRLGLRVGPSGQGPWPDRAGLWGAGSWLCCRGRSWWHQGCRSLSIKNVYFKKLNCSISFTGKYSSKPWNRWKVSFLLLLIYFFLMIWNVSTIFFPHREFKGMKQITNLLPWYWLLQICRTEDPNLVGK